MLPRISKEPALSLESVISELGKSPEAVIATSEIASAVAGALGQPMSAEAFALQLQDPGGVATFFSIRPADIALGFATAQSFVDLQDGAKCENAFKLPNRITLKAAPACFGATPWEPRWLCGNLYRYALPSDLTAQEIKRRSAFGEILDRLALNRSFAKDEQFCLLYRNTGYVDFDAFLDALLCSGHVIEMEVSNEVADFIHLIVRKDDGTFREVQTDLRIQTGHFTAEGNEIVVPAVHSHLNFRISGPHVNTTVEFYQGTHGTHFYPSSVVKGQSWVGIRVSATYSGTAAVKALKASALYLDLLHKISRDNALLAGGYGQTGICNDSVALIEVLLHKRVTVYPLFIDQKRIMTCLETMITDRPALSARYREMHEAVERLPSDFSPNGTQPQRILNSIPYGPGPTPHVGFNDARRTF